METYSDDGAKAWLCPAGSKGGRPIRRRFPNYPEGKGAYAVLWQVSGRVGRSHQENFSKTFFFAH
jgi:hypothetical protein